MDISGVPVLTSNQIARRWRDCNRASTPLYAEDEEDAWRTTTLKLISTAHTLGGITDISFEVVESKYSVSDAQNSELTPTGGLRTQDFAFELECETFKWRWETCFLGHRLSAEIISKQLIFPLISVNHLAFSSPDAVGEMSDADLEKVRKPFICCLYFSSPASSRRLIR